MGRKQPSNTTQESLNLQSFSFYIKTMIYSVLITAIYFNYSQCGTLEVQMDTIYNCWGQLELTTSYGGVSGGGNDTPVHLTLEMLG